VKGFFSGVDSTTLLVVGIAVLTVVIVIVVLVLFTRRESY
jgi:flagellar biosynthesis/type III secretory pathway M-ring protein FliF/YscJ